MYLFIGNVPDQDLSLQVPLPRMIFAMIHPDIKVPEATMGPIWDRQDPAGPHIGPMNLAIWAVCQ